MWCNGLSVDLRCRDFTSASGPRPPPPPEPGCPGGSLEGCTALFPLSPPSAYRDCLEACLARCSNGPSPNPTPPPPPPPNPSPNPPPTPPGPGPAPGPCPSGSLVRNHPLLFILILFFPSSSYFRCVASVREEHPSTKGKRRRAPTARSCGRPQQYPSHARTRSCPDTPPQKNNKKTTHTMTLVIVGIVPEGLSGRDRRVGRWILRVRGRREQFLLALR